MPKISTARKDERRRQILRAAMACFARSGFHQTTILDICAEAGLSAGAVYGYFDSKNSIIEALADYGRAYAAQRTAGAGAEPGSIGPLRAYLEALKSPEALTVNRLDVQIWAEAISNDQLRDIYLRARSDVIGTLAHMTRAAARGHDLESEALSELILAVIMGCEVRRAIEPSSDLTGVLDALFALLEAKTPKSPA